MRGDANSLQQRGALPQVSTMSSMSSFEMLIHDVRVIGISPSIPTHVYEVGSNTSLVHMLGHTASLARQFGGIRLLSIIAHGIVNQDCEGSFGIELGAEDVTHRNVGQFGVLHGLVQRIVLHCCAVAQIAADAELGGAGDGWSFCSRLANITGAYVVASTSIQIYSHDPDPDDPVEVRVGNGEIDMGEWEGDVFEFKPNGMARMLHHGPPVRPCECLNQPGTRRIRR